MAFNFKAMVANDLRRTFLNLEEFGETHKVEGKETTIVIDEDALKELAGGQKLGIAESSLLFCAAAEDLPPRRPAGEGLNVDGREYIILDWSEDMGLATVALGQNVTM
ncbi:sugar ABC transporter ATP-binding protein [Oscillibacter sp.]|uniref:sugar ABC transporter ATP-binding protein n=1 Tax=Oscillibacter sp. TaxID=1945593 RepID=UPI0025828E2C|nr:sugar ABC transporter ATP-binding protein [Oscillibacter sp.]